MGDFDCATPDDLDWQMQLWENGSQTQSVPLITCCFPSSVVTIYCRMLVESRATAPFDGMATPDGFYPVGNGTLSTWNTEVAIIDRCVQLLNEKPWPSRLNVNGQSAIDVYRVVHPEPITARPGRRIGSLEVGALYAQQITGENLQSFQLQPNMCPARSLPSTPEYNYSPDFWNISGGSMMKKLANGTIFIIAQKARVSLSEFRTGQIGTFNSCTAPFPFQVSNQIKKQIHTLNVTKVNHSSAFQNGIDYAILLVTVFKPT